MNTRHQLWGLVALSVLLNLSAAFTQTTRVIVLENADNVEGKQINGEPTREFVGHVRFRQENVHISCDRAMQFLSSGRVDLTGNVMVVDDSGVTLKCPRGIYFRDERRAVGLDTVDLDDGSVTLTAKYGEYFVDPKRAFFRNQVVVQDSASTVTADSLTYFRVDKKSVAQGDVKVYNKEDNVTITGHRLDHWSSKKFSRITNEPVLMQVDANKDGTFDTLIVHSRVMEAYQDSLKLLLAIDSVRIVRTDIAAVCRLAKFYTTADSIVLRGSPVVWYDETQVTGDSINVYLKKRKLDKVNVLGNAFAISQSDSNHPERYDQITGDVMKMQFVEKGLKEIDVENRAISLYHLYDDSLANGINKTSGDRIHIGFEDAKVATIRVVGGVEGQYFPETMVKNKERDYVIAGFELHANRPQMYPAATQLERQVPKK